MSQPTQPRHPDFEILFVELERPDAKVVLDASREIAEASAAIDEIARYTRDSWVPFTTFCSA